METVTKNYRYDFTEAELLSKSKKWAAAHAKLGQIEAEKTTANAQFKSRTATVDAEIQLLADHINAGYEFRSVECDIILNSPTVGWKVHYRQDNGEILGEAERMTPEELQGELMFEENKAKSNSQLELLNTTKEDDPLAENTDEPKEEK